MKRAIVIGATSGIGREVACRLAGEGWLVGACGRREALLQALQAAAPAGRIVIQPLDVTDPQAPERLQELIERMGGMDLFFLASGIGNQNPSLQPDVELHTLRTNGEGFVRMVVTAFNHFKAQASQAGQQARSGGHIAVISSIAGTKGLGMAPAYSATKRMQNTYIEALAQLSRMQHLHIRFTDIRPGFVDTDLLSGKRYPLLMPVERVANRIMKAIHSSERRCPRYRIIVIDGRYRLLVFFWRLIPRQLWERLPIRN
ncbi:MAG: SDR family NAD(P)-dependent oxidoreductase [Prevotellaceae bacterium]|jgi:NAD(P)-dependent dehydrogenase (short-subunit alcohol dehydrogenase family)|nr:SDR family NAD(P)-dependent oxidoreductase [Prevotellaceae bacterium]